MRPIPVISERDDVIVITDEAHRTQYDTLALNMRNALPNAGFLGFTGTPLIAGEERTREVFGDYVSVYNFAASDGRPRHGAAVLREPDPAAADRQPDLRRRPDGDRGGGRPRRGPGTPARPDARAAVRADHPRRPARRRRQGHRRPLPRPRVPRQGHGRLHRQGHGRPHLREGPALLEGAARAGPGDARRR